MPHMIPKILKKHPKKLIAMVVIASAFYAVIVRNPLPSDERMIAHLNEHRHEIEELIEKYRTYPSGRKVDHSLWFKDGNTQQLLARSGVDGITFGAPGPWLPNPYSVESAKKVDFETKSATSFELFHKYGALRISLNPRNKYHMSHLRYINIWKDLYYFPEAPRIENSELLGPYDVKGEYSSRARVISSLDDFPKGWKPYECVYRQIEVHWFVRMCNGH